MNQTVILVGYGWAGVLTREVWRLAVAFALPAALGIALGMAAFGRVDQALFRRIVYLVLLGSGLALLVRG
ncbi:MAG: hypothetical protein HY294_16925 [Candidatus Rokubacteria bacterium]|nr:hypothetical protein [Candidatus Rokubacteria bacterium]MBI3827677.1 hypothetical protein [Candidatus Rokubacteria bacterium]